MIIQKFHINQSKYNWQKFACYFILIHFFINFNSIEMVLLINLYTSKKKMNDIQPHGNIDWN